MSTDVLIVTRQRDFHAHAVRLALASRGVSVALLFVDRLHGTPTVSWPLDQKAPRPSLLDIDGRPVHLDVVRVLWLRRLRGDPSFPSGFSAAEQEFVVNECRGALEGVLRTTFRGLWINDIDATRRGENKLLQLRIASAVGLRVPRTLVSQDPDEVRRFCGELGYQVIVKSLVGAPRVPTMTGALTRELLTEEAIRWCPTIYQEKVDGTRHLRVCAFGEACHSVLIQSERLDWRFPLDARMEPHDLDGTTAACVRAFDAEIGLTMGIFDFKFDSEGKLYFLEINPQGQFLFMEPDSGVPLLEYFADFIEEMLARAATT